MKPINITEEDKIKIVKDMLKKLEKELDTFTDSMNDTKFTFSYGLSEVAKEKVTILFAPIAYLKMMALVDEYATEVGWYGLTEKLDDKLYRVYDVKMCKQIVDGAKVDTDDKDTLEFFESLTDEEAEHLHFQGHSHVNMSTAASSIDLQNQADVVHNMGKTGYYIFQIWNKSGNISTYLYDLDDNVYYDSKDIIIEIEDGDNDVLSTFIDESHDLVEERKPAQYYPNYYSKEKKSNNKKEPMYSDVFPGYNGYEDW